MSSYHRLVIFVVLAITVYPLIVSADIVVGSYLIVSCNVTNTICPMAHFCDATAGRNNDQGKCMQCDAGFFCPGGTARIMCPRGHMCPGSLSPTAIPIPCPDNTMATQDAFSCSPCPTPFFTNNELRSRCDEITGLTIGLIVITSILVLALVFFTARRFWRRKKADEVDLAREQYLGEGQADTSVHPYQNA